MQCAYNPNFHFAACVAVDSEDGVVVTCENWAINDPDAVNENWGFCNCGSTDRSENCNTNQHDGKHQCLPTYHQALTGSGGHGNVALTFLTRLL